MTKKSTKRNTKKTQTPQAPSILSEEGRIAIYTRNKGLFLVHKFTGTNKTVVHEGKEYKFINIDIYLKGHHNRNSLNEVKSASFFLGHMFNNNLHTIELDPESEKQKGLSPSEIFGFTTSAYGSMLCTCVVTLKDGSTVELEHYVDFEHVSLLQEKEALEQKNQDLQNEFDTLKAKVKAVQEKIALHRQQGGCKKSQAQEAPETEAPPSD